MDELSTKRAAQPPQDEMAGVASLVDPVRRALYRFVVAHPEPVTREQASQAASVPVHVAKFHLERLLDDGLLTAEYHRPAGRSGPGAGRPAKYYRRSERSIEVSLPPRQYDLAGHLLAEAIVSAASTRRPVEQTVGEVATRAGQSLADEVRQSSGRRASRRKVWSAALAVLDQQGYQPCLEGNEVTLRNCPFHALAQTHTDLVCGMNLALLRGLVDGAGLSGVEAVLQPSAGACCVRLVAHRTN